MPSEENVILGIGCTALAIYFVLALAFWGMVGFVVVHFIMKWW